jgi:hypothetical protein
VFFLLFNHVLDINVLIERTVLVISKTIFTRTDVLALAYKDVQVHNLVYKFVLRVCLWVDNITHSHSAMFVAVGAGCTFVINEGGALLSWGRNGFRELGRHGTGEFVPSMSHSVTPMQIIAFGNTVQTVTAKGSRAACIMADGSVWMWGKSNMTPEPRTNKPPRHIAMQEFGGERPVLVAYSKTARQSCRRFGSAMSSQRTTRRP